MSTSSESDKLDNPNIFFYRDEEKSDSEKSINEISKDDEQTICTIKYEINDDEKEIKILG